MTVFEVIKKRYSCRAYQDKPIEQEKLDQIFEAARQAPSAKNLQDWRFVVVIDKQVKQRVVGCTNHQDAFGQGTRIRHPSFGEGKIVAKRGDIVTIQFDSGKRKDFALSIAPLQII